MVEKGGNFRDSENPIGIFDSGIGGLTVAHAISHLLPHEQLIYYGDTAHMPYGEKSLEHIQRYSLEITRFLIENQRCKAVVIACNTASAAAYEVLKNRYLGKIPIINVIDPMIEHIVEHNYRNVGIIATRTTIESGVYQQKLHRRKPEQQFSALATPLLASMVEEHFVSGNVSRTILENYLSNPMLDNIDALVLACTHYPLIENEIDDFYKGKVHLLNSAKIVAEKTKKILAHENLINTLETKKENQFLVSDLTENFKKTAEMFYGMKLNLREHEV